MISTYTSKLKQLQIGDLIAKIPINILKDIFAGAQSEKRGFRTAHADFVSTKSLRTL